MAIIAILKAPEVIAFRKEHNIGPEVDWGPGIAFPSDAFAVEKPRQLFLGPRVGGRTITPRPSTMHEACAYHQFTPE
jgi:hypothetical protein